MQSKSQERLTSKQMHNRNAYNYLGQLVITDKMTTDASGDLKRILNGIPKSSDPYNQSVNYAAKFTELFEYIEANSTVFKNDVYDDLIISIYENRNKNLKDTHNLIQDQVVNLSHKRTSPEHSVGGVFNWAPQDALSMSPTREESNYNRFQSVYGKDFTPQSRTNMPFILQKNDQSMQMHFGTQARRKNEQAKVSKTFELYLNAKYRNNPNHVHLYINKLGLDRTQLPKNWSLKIYQWAKKVLEGVREYCLTKELHDFAETQTNLYMVTLPADKGNMGANAYIKHTDEINRTNATNLVLDVLNNPSNINSPDENNIKDFYLGKKVEDALYPEQAEKSRGEMHQEMVGKSAKFLGLAKREHISTAEQQALFFHTFAFEFTEKLLDILQPDSWNCSCKDAIDRGKAHYAYYNLVKTFTTDGMQPWTFDQFNEALHGTATMVKGRGMNNHHKIVWNAVDVYVTNNYDDLVIDPNKNWLIEWRNLNCPIERVDALLEDTISRARTISDTISQNDAKSNYFNGVLNFVQENKSGDESHKQHLLTALTTSMAIERSDYTNDAAAKERHQLIIEKLPQENTWTAWIKGALTALCGLMASNKDMIQKGKDLMSGTSNLEELKEQVEAEKNDNDENGYRLF